MTTSMWRVKDKDGFLLCRGGMTKYALCARYFFTEKKAKKKAVEIGGTVVPPDNIRR